MLFENLPEERPKQFEETGDIDFGIRTAGTGPLSRQFFMQKLGIAACFG